MPRLEGHRSNTGMYLLLLVLLALVALLALDYAGMIDLIPGFGQA